MNMTADYSFDIGKDQKSSCMAMPTTSPASSRDAINTQALRAGLSIPRWPCRLGAEQTFELAAFVTNITDEVYLTNGVNVGGLGYVEAYYSRPREWGISASAKF